MRPEQLHDLLESAAGDGATVDVAGGRAAVDHRRRVAQGRRITGVVVVLALLAGLAVLVFGGEDRNEVFVGDDVPRLVPDPVPAGLEPEEFRAFPVAGTVGTDIRIGAQRQWLWRPGGATDWSVAVLVDTTRLEGLSGDRDEDRTPAVGDDLVTATWFDDEVAVSVQARGLRTEEVASIAESIEVDPTPDLVAVDLPDGWIAEASGLVDDHVSNTPVARSTGYSALWSEPAAVRARTLLVVTTASPDLEASAAIEEFVAGGPVVETSVAGRAATLTHRPGNVVTGVTDGAVIRREGPPIPVVLIRWDGLLVAVQAWGFTDTEALAIAASLRPATDAEWDAWAEAAASRTFDPVGSEVGEVTDTSVCETTPDGGRSCTVGGGGTPVGPTTTVVESTRESTAESIDAP